MNGLWGWKCLVLEAICGIFFLNFFVVLFIWSKVSEFSIFFSIFKTFEGLTLLKNHIGSRLGTSLLLKTIYLHRPSSSFLRTSQSSWKTFLHKKWLEKRLSKLQHFQIPFRRHKNAFKWSNKKFQRRKISCDLWSNSLNKIFHNKLNAPGVKKGLPQKKDCNSSNNNNKKLSTYPGL